MKPRINVADAIADSAPPPPPCFHSGHIWREYLTSAAEYLTSSGHDDKRNRRKAFILMPDGHPVYNPNFDFCKDCLTERAAQAQQDGRCHPDHFRRVATTAGES
jgi:hypothetical protein